jgi:hypothetical protein
MTSADTQPPLCDDAAPCEDLDVKSLFTLPSLVNQVIDRFLTELSAVTVNVSASAPSRIVFPCLVSDDVVPSILRRIPGLLPDGMLLLEAGTHRSRKGSQFHITLRNATEAELVLAELLPTCRRRLGKHLSFQTDVQHLTWTLRHVHELGWDTFAPTDFREAKADTTEDGEASNDVEAQQPDELAESAAAEVKLLTRLAQYHVALSYHNTMSRAYTGRGYDDYYPPLPLLCEDVLSRIQAAPESAEILQRYETARESLSVPLFKSLSVERQRAYFYLINPDEPPELDGAKSPVDDKTEKEGPNVEGPNVEGPNVEGPNVEGLTATILVM